MKKKGIENRINMKISLFLTTSLFLGLLYSCTSSESMTKRLFMQSRRANVELPNQTGMYTDSVTGMQIITEEVSFRHQDNHSESLRNDSTKNDITKVQRLNEVVVTAKTRFAPERDGKVSVDFLVRVPKELLASEWRLTLAPQLLHNDSIVPLDSLVLKGQAFKDKQVAGYAAYDSYVNSIIGKGAYDDNFLDRKNIDRDLRKRQEHYWNLYQKQWSKLMSYQKWRSLTEERYAIFNAKQEGYRATLYHKYMRKNLEESVYSRSVGKDTLGLHDHYMRKFEKRADFFPQYKLVRELNSDNVLDKYRYFFVNNITPDNLKNQVTTEEDSIQIAQHRYFFGSIAENEMKDSRRADKFRELIPFAYETGNRLDSIVDNSTDFLFYYKQEYPVEIGLKRLRITMDGHIVATDKSSYSLAKADTLSYFISSLAQLADTTLVTKKTKLYRNMFDRQVIYPKFAPNKTDFDIRLKDNRAQVDTLISTYKLYTQKHQLLMDSLEIVASTALDGSYDNNANLSEKRVLSFKKYLEEHQLNGLGDLIKTSFKGEDWSALVAHLKQRTDIVHKDEILTILSTAVYPDATEKDIQQKYKADYKIIKDSIYPLLHKMEVTFNLRRSGMEVNDSLQIEVRDDYEEGIRLLLDRDYWNAMQLLANYPDYNAALCLACMGYNGKAYDLLVTLPMNANTEYLMAILCSRLDKEAEAVEHLLKACELNPIKAHRALIDSETAQLVRKYNLRAQLNQATDIELAIPADEDPSEVATDEEAVQSEQPTETEEVAEVETNSESAEKVD